MVGSIHSNTYGLPQPTLLTKSLLSTTPNPLPPPPPPLFTLKAYGVSIFFSLSFASTLPCFPLFEKSLHLSFFAIIHASPVFFGTYPHFKSLLSPPTYLSKKYPDTKKKKKKKTTMGRMQMAGLALLESFPIFLLQGYLLNGFSCFIFLWFSNPILLNLFQLPITCFPSFLRPCIFNLSLSYPLLNFP